MAGRYTYAQSYKSRDAAFQALSDMFADSLVSEGEAPRVESYASTRKARLNAFNVIEHRVTKWRITLEG